ncbi:hypothetical protein KC319_g55 [Hortaea werneckii]|nr:hypothetical protein KC319_g55 [Hortaea werneckii]
MARDTLSELRPSHEPDCKHNYARRQPVTLRSSSLGMATSKSLEAPRCPATLEEFPKQLNDNREAWYNYTCDAANQNAYLISENAVLRNQIVELQEKETAVRSELTEAQGVTRFQQKEGESLYARYYNRDRKRSDNLSSQTSCEYLRDAPCPLPWPRRICQRYFTASDSIYSRRQQKDLNRFVKQNYQKLTVNRDRFRTPKERMAYVISRVRI